MPPLDLSLLLGAPDFRSCAERPLEPCQLSVISPAAAVSVRRARWMCNAQREGPSWLFLAIGIESVALVEGE